jgi:O-succinylbenzoic acid--CoA ligase
VPRALVQRAHAAGVRVSLTYGLTEACSQVTTTPARTFAAGAPEPGPPLFCTRVAIAGDSDGQDGEILVRGPTVAPRAADGDGWLHSGDVGVIDERGRLHVTGRASELIISGGENVAPAEVEAALESHPDVLEAAAVGRTHEEWGEAVTAIVVAVPGQIVDVRALRAHCARELAPFKVPREILVRERPLPRTPSGKLLRRKL